jgi:hypothetical protein
MINLLQTLNLKAIAYLAIKKQYYVLLCTFNINKSQIYLVQT